MCVYLRSSEVGSIANAARDTLRVHIYDCPHGSLSHVVRRLALKAAAGTTDLEVAASFVSSFCQEF